MGRRRSAPTSRRPASTSLGMLRRPTLACYGPRPGLPGLRLRRTDSDLVCPSPCWGWAQALPLTRSKDRICVMFKRVIKPGSGMVIEY